MVRSVVKIILALLVIHGTARIGIAYWNYYQFEDKIGEIAQFGERQTDRQLCDQMLEAAATSSIPIAAVGLTIRRGNKTPFNCETGSEAAQAGRVVQAASQMTIEGVYVDQVQILPGYMYAWEFRPSVKRWTRLY